MQLATPLIFITAVWSLVESASIAENANYSPHLIGGSLVDKDVPQPIVGVFRVVNDTGEVYKTCGATLLKIDYRFAKHFITAAECFDQIDWVGQKLYLRYFSSVSNHYGYDYAISTYNIHPWYNKDTKEHNIAMFRTAYEFDDVLVHLWLSSGWSKFHTVFGYEGITGITQTQFSEELIPVSQPVEVFSWENFTTQRDYWDLYSIKTETINSVWCTILYPFSPIKNNRLCASGWNGKGLSKNNIGSPVIQRDPKDEKRFSMVAIATLPRPWSASLNMPMEFVNLALYKSWIKSVLMS